jgi:hypothetical protein
MASNVMGTVYIIQFEPAYKDSRGREVYGYIGWTSNLRGRLYHHRHGTGSRMCAVAVQAGCKLNLIYDTAGTRADERKLKNWKNCRLLVASLGKKGLLNAQRKPAKKSRRRDNLPEPYTIDQAGV